MKTVPELLAELGNTPEEIAKKLWSMRMFGYKCDSGRCPVANYLRKETGTDAVEVGGHLCWVDGVQYDLPEPVSEFVINFDGNSYPFLWG